MAAQEQRLVRMIADLQAQLKRCQHARQALSGAPLLDRLIAERDGVLPLFRGPHPASSDAAKGPLLDRLVAERDCRDHYRRG